MEVVSKLSCPQCGWRGLVASDEVAAADAQARRQALVWRHVRREHHLLDQEAQRLLDAILQDHRAPRGALMAHPRA
jgi:hypothetical protein